MIIGVNKTKPLLTQICQLTGNVCKWIPLERSHCLETSGATMHYAVDIESRWLEVDHVTRNNSN